MDARENWLRRRFMLLHFFLLSADPSQAQQTTSFPPFLPHFTSKSLLIAENPQNFHHLCLHYEMEWSVAILTSMKSRLFCSITIYFLIILNVLLTFPMSAFAKKKLTAKEVPQKLQQTLQDHKNGKIQEAIEGYEAVIPFISAAPTLLSLHGNVGALYLSTGEFEKAKSHFERAVELNPDNAQAHFNLAVLLTSKLNQHGKAIKHCGLAIKLDNGNHKYYHLMGNILQNLGKDKESEKYFQIAEDLAAAASQPTENSNDPETVRKNVEIIKNHLVPNLPFSLATEEHDILIEDKAYHLRVESLNPLIFTVDNFLSEEECDYIMNQSRHKLEKSFVMGNSVKVYSEDQTTKVSGTSSISGELSSQEKLENEQKDEGEIDQLYRSSFNTWLSLDHRLMHLQEKLSKLLNIPVGYIKANSEDLQVVKYDVHGQFKIHQDSSAFHSRLMTILFYLNDINSAEHPTVIGGETWFPFATPLHSQGSSMSIPSVENAILQALNSYDSFSTEWKNNPDVNDHSLLPGVKVTPKKGKVVIFFNYAKENDNLDPLAVHAGLPLRPAKSEEENENLKNEKWIANYWIKFNKEELSKL